MKLGKRKVDYVAASCLFICNTFAKERQLFFINRVWSLFDFSKSPSKIEHMSDYWIRASEISNYVYCRRSWWLKRQRGAASRNVRELKRGTDYHQQHGRTVWQAVWLRRLAFVALFVLLAFITFQLMMR